MAKTILVCGYGSGISDAVARRFGKQGFQVAIVARSEDKLQKAAADLNAAGIKAKGYACDLADAAAVASLVERVRSELGPITIVHWNAYIGGAGDLLSSSVEELHKVLSVSVSSLIVAVQKALPDLRAQKGESAVLVTGGGFALYDDGAEQGAVGWNSMGLAIAKAAQRKATRLLHHKLKADGIYAGEVVVLGLVKGTAFDQGGATLEGSTVADAFWDLYQKRGDVSVMVSG